MRSYSAGVLALSGGARRALLGALAVRQKRLAQTLVALSFQVRFEVFAPDLYVAPELDAWYLPALYAPIHPALAHPQLLADIVDREEVQVSPSRLGLLFVLQGALPPLLPSEGLFELRERDVQSF